MKTMKLYNPIVCCKINSTDLKNTSIRVYVGAIKNMCRFSEKSQVCKTIHYQKTKLRIDVIPMTYPVGRYLFDVKRRENM